MKLDIALEPSGDLRADADRIDQAATLGFAGAWTRERGRNPFLPLTLAPGRREDFRLGTLDARAFPRSPMVMAQIAWDLARQSQGRFVLGLSAADLAKSEQDGDPLARLREYIESLRAIWDTFQTDARLRYRGEFYTFRLIAPFFNPGPIAKPEIPIVLEGGRPQVCELAGELAQGLAASPAQSPAQLRDQVLPSLERSLARAGRSRGDFTLIASALAVSGADDASRRRSESHAKARLATAASDANPGAALQDLAIVAPPDEIRGRIVERYAGLADRVCVEWAGHDASLLRAIMDA